MKHQLALFTLLLPLAAQAQDKPTKPSLKALEEKYGFRDAHFEADTTEFKDLVLLGKDKDTRRYSRTGDKMMVGEAEISRITYYFYLGKLSFITLNTTGLSNSKALLGALAAQYGAGDKRNQYAPKYWWSSKRVLLIYDEHSNGNAEVTMSSKVVAQQAEQQAQQQHADAAKKATSDL